MVDTFLGIDLGTSSVKVLLVDEGGQVRGAGSAEYPVRRPGPAMPSRTQRSGGGRPWRRPSRRSAGPAG